MKRFGKVVKALGILLMGAGLLYGGAEMKEGRWSITVKIEAPGMPMVIPPVTKTECIKGDAWTPKVGPVENCGNCRITEREMSGNVFTWKEVCESPEGKLYAEGKIVFKGESFTGVVKIRQGEMTMTNRMEGRWIGPCN